VGLDAVDNDDGVGLRRIQICVNGHPLRRRADLYALYVTQDRHA
jgi:hypothetical protein